MYKLTRIRDGKWAAYENEQPEPTKVGSDVHIDGCDTHVKPNGDITVHGAQACWRDGSTIVLTDDSKRSRSSGMGTADGFGGLSF